MTWIPAPNYRYAVGKGMSGADVWGCQLNVIAAGQKITADGIYGSQTEKAVKAFQGHRKISPADGVCGPVTMRELCLVLSRAPADSQRLPDGLLKGLMANESGFIIPAYSRHPSDTGFDLGPYQQSFPPGRSNEQSYAAAYNAKTMADLAARNMRQLKDRYRQAPHVATDEWAWQLAALSHNWPMAAQNLANIGSIYQNPSTDNEPQAWIQVASGGALSTPRQWVEHYIAKACLYVQSYGP